MKAIQLKSMDVIPTQNTFNVIFSSYEVIFRSARPQPSPLHLCPPSPTTASSPARLGESPSHAGDGDGDGDGVGDGDGDPSAR